MPSYRSAPPIWVRFRGVPRGSAGDEAGSEGGTLAAFRDRSKRRAAAGPRAPAAGGARAQVACGDTVTGKVELTADLACPGAGLVVGADKTKIDLKGFTLTGNPGTVGIDNGGGFDAVTIENGSIEEFDEGVSIGGNAQKNVVRDLVVLRLRRRRHRPERLGLRPDHGHRSSPRTAPPVSRSGPTRPATSSTSSFAIGNADAGHPDRRQRQHGAEAATRRRTPTGSSCSATTIRSPATSSTSTRRRASASRATTTSSAKNYATGNLLDGIEVKGGARATLDKNESSGNRELGDPRRGGLGRRGGEEEHDRGQLGQRDRRRGGLRRRAPRAQQLDRQSPRRHRNLECEHHAAQEHGRREPRARHHGAGRASSTPAAIARATTPTPTAAPRSPATRGSRGASPRRPSRETVSRSPRACSARGPPSRETANPSPANGFRRPGASPRRRSRLYSRDEIVTRV